MAGRRTIGAQELSIRSPNSARAAARSSRPRPRSRMTSPVATPRRPVSSRMRQGISYPRTGCPAWGMRPRLLRASSSSPYASGSISAHGRTNPATAAARPRRRTVRVTMRRCVLLVRFAIPGPRLGSCLEWCLRGQTVASSRSHVPMKRVPALVSPRGSLQVQSHDIAWSALHDGARSRP